MTITSKIWVLIEATAPVFTRAGLELLTPARDLADQSGQPLAAVVMGCHVEETARQAVALGADEVLVLDHPAFAQYETMCFVHALSWLLETYPPAPCSSAPRNTAGTWPPDWPAASTPV